ncbi:AAA-ATPase vps4-associated protein 1 domain-containing protein [Pochonia chlamydosporia 170]|uniref:AAA-ATPase vps4-associated protein 1 domain-containing protein n=1 Tax=Pochonia chlamydosporia 170 TaxID=1380566 RepID=A0A179FZ00_METCM|nr:AAA-ATPase vps4-associated protein 1 domain-containing protein [Pochonia chlamydosporia 170]OAQ70864.1 AAA-ATPase vps4-associated protein 1 domain-containing protein [Pochonia chlamydosporia 170]
MSAPFPNLYTHRKVAESASKACDICYKPSTSVLITPDKKDFFYVCPAHLKDTYFCTPKIDEEALKAKREKELAEETEKLKKEYVERQRKKKEKAAKDKDKKDDKDKDKDQEKESDKKDDKDKAESTSTDDAKDKESSTPTEEPRVFELKSAFYQQRLQRKRQAEAAKRDRERVSQPGYFPSVPSGPPTK